MKFTKIQIQGLKVIAKAWSDKEAFDDICPHPDLDCSKNSDFNKTVCKAIFPKTIKKKNLCPCECYTGAYIKKVLRKYAGRYFV